MAGRVKLITIIGVVIVMIILGIGLKVFSEKRIPLEYKSLYNYLEIQLKEVSNYTTQASTIKTNAIVYGAELLTANSNRGDDLLEDSAIEGVKLELDNMQNLGVKGVTVTIAYPLLHSRNPNFEKMLKFYKQVSQEIKNRNLTLVVETGVVFSGTSFSTYTIDFSRIPFDEYKKEAKVMYQTIIDEIKPDYFDLGTEADTYANLTGYTQLKDVAGFVGFMGEMIAELNKQTTKVGAGSATWLGTKFAQSLVENVPLDFLSVHIYPINLEIVKTFEKFAELAHSQNIPIIVDETWLYKARANETVENVAATTDIFKRDVYSFWQPLDEMYFQIIVNLCKKFGCTFISPFWSKYFFSYLTYKPMIESLSYSEVVSLSNKSVVDSFMHKKLSSLGQAYQKLIRQ